MHNAISEVYDIIIKVMVMQKHLFSLLL
jgi:hypothetical protein